MKDWYSPKEFTGGWTKSKFIWLLSHLLELDLLGWAHRDGLDGSDTPNYMESEGHIPTVGQQRLYDYTWENQRTIRGALDKKLDLLGWDALYLLAHFSLHMSYGRIARLTGLDKKVIMKRVEIALERICPSKKHDGR